MLMDAAKKAVVSKSNIDSSNSSKKEDPVVLQDSESDSKLAREMHDTKSKGTTAIKEHYW